VTSEHRDDLVDAPLRDEILLVGELVIAAARSDGHLSDADIDRVLGVRRCTDAAKQPVAG
jgi:hypothetical protein